MVGNSVSVLGMSRYSLQSSMNELELVPRLERVGAYTYLIVSARGRKSWKALKACVEYEALGYSS
jgi:hypothetical protein